MGQAKGYGHSSSGSFKKGQHPWNKGMSSPATISRSERSKRWAKANRHKTRITIANWRKNNPHKYRAQVSRHLQRVLEEQERVAGRPKPITCEVCWQRGKIVFDHDHVTGEFRGWICEKCNKTLGNSGDSVERLLLLARYLQ